MWMLALLLAAASVATGGEPLDHGGGAHAPASSNPTAPVAQTTCPVLAGNPIDPSIYTVYEGKKVYFCCQACKAAFEKEPEKYLSRLPQFAGEDAEHGGALAELIQPLGITTLTLLLLTAGAGLFRRRSPRLLLRLHKILALLTVLAALNHATLVLLLD